MSREAFLSYLRTLGPQAAARYALDATDSPTDWFAVVPSDSDYLEAFPDQLYVAGAGDVVIESFTGSLLTLTVGAGATINASPARVRATGTTATGIIGLLRGR